MGTKGSKYFFIEEFLPKDVDPKHFRHIMDNRIVWTADRLRERFGKAYINNWLFGGNNQFRGWRPPESTVGATFSQHRFGRALDMTFEDSTPEEIRKDLRIVGRFGAYRYITACEDGVSWLHVDCRFVGGDPDEIMFFKP